MILSLFLFFTFAEEPIHIDEEGTYYYKPAEKEVKNIDTKFGKAKKTKDGVYYYKLDKKKEERTKETTYGKPIKVVGEASYYQREVSPQDKAITLHFTTINFTEFKSGTTKYRDVYNNANALLLDFEWHKQMKAIKLGYIVSSGLMTAGGGGRFAGTTNPNETPKEKYDLLIVPINAKLRFNFQFKDSQWIVPYVDIGAGAYAMLERRDDGEQNNTAYTPILTAGGGFNFLLDWMNPLAMSKIDNEFGVNHIWLHISYHLTQATESDFDLSNNQLQFGFKFDY